MNVYNNTVTQVITLIIKWIILSQSLVCWYVVKPDSRLREGPFRKCKNVFSLNEGTSMFVGNYTVVECRY